MDEYMIDYVDTDTTCNICYAEFLDLEDLQIHKAQVHTAKSSRKPCQFCSATYTDVEEYALHIRDAHITQFSICEFCKRIFVDVDEHRIHVGKHHKHPNNFIYTCSQCAFNTISVKMLENHEFSEHMNVKDGVFIYDCLPHLSSVLSTNALKFIQCLKSDMVFFCAKCDSSYLNPDDYIDHLKINNCQSYSCNKCSFAYKRKTGIIKHLRSHKECTDNQTEEVLKKCNQCLENIPAYMLREHKRNCKVIRCTQCDITFNNVYDLSKHQMEEHATACKFQVCKYCKKEFVGDRALKRHFQRSHKSKLHLFKYICKYCDAAFKHPKSLFGHFFTRHKDLEPYTCKLCDKKFRIRKNFTIHIKLEHKSIGFVEFDENYHVFFTDKKSKEPFQPTAKITYEEESSTNAEDSDVPIKEEPEHYSRKSNQKSGKQIKNVALTKKGTAHLKPGHNGSKIKKIDDQTTDTDVTETEGDQTEVETQKPKPLKRSLRSRTLQKKIKKDASENEFTVSSSEDEPLLIVKKKEQRKRSINKNSILNNRFSKKKAAKHAVNRFKCNYCNKQCYTFQNYHKHLNTLHKDKMKTCVKCNIVFATKQKLSDHIAQEHSSSRLTEVLKSLIEKRKNESNNPSVIPTKTKFRRTIKKVECVINEVPATVTPYDDKNPSKLSVQKFIESFMPESNDTEKNKAAVESNISIRAVRNMSKPPLINLHKFEAKRNDENKFKPKLAMPVKYKSDFREEHHVKVTMIQNPITQPETIVENEAEETFYVADHVEDTYHENDDTQFETDDKQDIPEVAEEVMLEGSEEIPKVHVPHKIVIPNVPKEINKMRIAHLVPVAPYYKIVKVKDVIEKSQPKKPEPKIVKLPDGTKLVNVNPLAHLIGDKNILENYKPKKYHTPKAQDFEQAVAKALMKVDKPAPKRAGKKKKNTEELTA